MPLITGADATILMLHEEMRAWRQKGVTFTPQLSGGINIQLKQGVDGDLNRQANAYRAMNAAAIRNYLAFVGDDDPDEAIKRLEFAWHQREKCVQNEQKVTAMSDVTPYPNKPLWVQKLDSEIQGLEKERDAQRKMFEGYTKRLEELREKRKPWTDIENGPTE